jgi:8-oxo-dGTP diphosphatase
MCEHKYSYKYPHPSVTTDCVIFGIDSDNKLKVLLIERMNEPFKGCWAFPGGFLEMDEDADHGAKRELKEETGLEVNYLKQFHTFSSPDRDPRERVISIAYYGVVPVQEVAGGDDAARAQWFGIDDVPPMAFDHESMLTMAMEALRQELHFEIAKE